MFWLWRGATLKLNLNNVHDVVDLKKKNLESRFRVARIIIM